MTKPKDATQMFTVIFDDGTQREADRFTMAATFGSALREDVSGRIHYRGDTISFVAVPNTERSDTHDTQSIRH